ncbi:hypothetical protein BC939DRAFT_453779 [Gamsiella multidivaricata]|uniref:uncharacterized protein n=1 Tax=Gamsiella multidivaricata TaxID=101098 RepID=UPI00221F3C32|nr:uncharacterized protein BC939DRAFT_453779 [Gamsiella multidivaricata]KAI7822615.1 hypothetical protein BC939DRAFT_453779 [Gamsiella multidivaricata]
MHPIANKSSSSDRHYPSLTSSASPSQFSPSSQVSKFMALRRLSRTQQAPPSSSTHLPLIKRLKHEPPTLDHAKRPPAPSSIIQSKPNSLARKAPLKALNPSQSQDRNCTRVSDHLSTNIKPRPYDSLLPPSFVTHRYIVSNRILQNTAIVRALLDPDCGRVQLVERDMEYLRALLPECTRNRAAARVEADIILDEGNAVLLYPLREIGQAIIQDPDAGLNELLVTLARIGPRYKSVWLILEEYNWSGPALSKPKQLSARGIESTPTQTHSAFHPALKQPMSSPSHRSDDHSATVSRLDPFAGPVMPQLNKLTAWVPSTHTRSGWLSRLSYCSALNLSSHQSPTHSRQLKSVQDSFPNGYNEASELVFETRVLFASDERCAAWMTRAIGERIAVQIDIAAQSGLRRDEDGWRSREEWLWRDWLNEQDSTHERFLASFGLFNPFSIQLILSLCSLKELMSMDHKQRVSMLGKFIDSEILATFNKIVSGPLI